MRRRIEPELMEHVADMLASGASPQAAAARLHLDVRLIRRIASLQRARGRGRRHLLHPRRPRAHEPGRPARRPPSLGLP